MSFKIVTISDTHGKHNWLTKNNRLPQGDIIIHAGDATPRGKRDDIEEFFRWFGDLDYSMRIMIAGNHDWVFEQDSDWCEEMAKNYAITYLNDSGTTYNGIKIWGSPVQPEFMNWAFNRARDKKEATVKKIPIIKTHWDKIPKDTDILITHGPAYKHCDKVTTDMSPNCGENVGCVELEKKIQKIRPTLHVSGHIHEARGVDVHNPKGKSPITYVNTSTLDELYMPWNEDAFVFDWDDLLDGRIKKYSSNDDILW